MVALKRPLFKPGQVVATPAAIKAIEVAQQSVMPFLARHLSGDWGELDAEDKAANNQALVDGSRILSAYTLTNGEKIWIITEAADDAGDREATTVLLPDEY